MRFLKCLSLILVLQCLFLNAAFAEEEPLMQDGVVVSYELGEEEPGKFSIEIQNDNRYDVEVILNVYATVKGRALDRILCNEDSLKTYELEAGRILRVIEPGCEPKRFRTLEAYVKIIGVKPLETPEESDVELETPTTDSAKDLVTEEVGGAAASAEATPLETPAASAEATPLETPASSAEATPLETPAASTEATPLETPAASAEVTPLETPAAQEQQTEPQAEISEAPAVAAEKTPIETPLPDTQEEVAETLPQADVEKIEEEPMKKPEAAEAVDMPLEVETITAFDSPDESKDAEKTDETPIELDTVSELMPDAEETPEPVEEKIPDPIVREIQAALEALGYNPGPVDGLLGQKTEAALRSFQEAEQLPVDGLPSATLLAMLSERQDQLAKAPKSSGKVQVSQADEDTLVYGVLIDGPRESAILKNLHEEFVRTFREYFTVEQKLLLGDWTRTTVAHNLDTLLDDPEVDVIVALDLIASHEASHRLELSKPVFAPLVLDPEMQQLPLDGSSSGVKNLNYLLSIPRIKDGVDIFRRMASFDKMAIVVSRYYYDAFPEMRSYIDENSRAAQEEDGLDVSAVLVKDSVDELLAEIPTGTEAVYLIPIMNFSEEQHTQLIAALNEKNLLSFSHLGYDDVEKGVLATIAPKNDLQRLSRRIVLNVQRSLEGENPGEFSVYFLKEGEEQLVINMETARDLDFYPTFATKVDAILLHEDPQDIGRQLTLASAVAEALEANLELLSKQQEVKAGEENIAIAKALRLPQLDLSLDASAIDGDRASAMAFGASETMFSGSAGLEQLIYSDKVNANVSIQKYGQQNLEDQLEETKLDIILLASSAYLNVLRAKTFLNIQKDNLELTKSNLDVARTRVSVGVAGKGELYRWEASLAGSRQEVIDAENSLKQAEFTLNRILHRDQEELFGTEESTMSDPFLLDDNPLMAHIKNERDFEHFRNFAVEVGLASAPELAQIDSAIEAQKRLGTAYQREYIIPSVGLQGDLTGIFAKGGEGSDGMNTEGLPPELASAFESPDDVGWFVGIGVSLPIFSGGGKRAEYRQAQLELEKLAIDKAKISEALEQRIRAYIYQTGNSYTRISYAQDAADAARKTLDLVTKAYLEGLALILDVIDAQHTTLVAEELVADNTYNFLLDLMHSQRATNRFDFLLTPEERQKVWQEFEMYLQTQ